MSGQKTKRGSLLILICTILLIIFWIGFAIGIFNLFKGISGEINKVYFLKSETFRASMLDVYIEIFLKKVITFWILFHLQLILLSISREKPFDPRNHGRIRKIAYGAFAFALFHLLSNLYWSGLPELKLSSLYSYIKGQATLMTLFAVSIFIIGTAFERGSGMQKDQDLTI
jgi:hypothetical protein